MEHREHTWLPETSLYRSVFISKKHPDWKLPSHVYKIHGDEHRIYLPCATPNKINHSIVGRYAGTRPMDRIESSSRVGNSQLPHSRPEHKGNVPAPIVWSRQRGCRSEKHGHGFLGAKTEMIRDSSGFNPFGSFPQGV